MLSILMLLGGVSLGITLGKIIWGDRLKLSHVKKAKTQGRVLAKVFTTHATLEGKPTVSTVINTVEELDTVDVVVHVGNGSFETRKIKVN